MLWRLSPWVCWCCCSTLRGFPPSHLAVHETSSDSNTARKEDSLPPICFLKVWSSSRGSVKGLVLPKSYQGLNKSLGPIHLGVFYMLHVSPLAIVGGVSLCMTSFWNGSEMAGKDVFSINCSAPISGASALASLQGTLLKRETLVSQLQSGMCAGSSISPRPLPGSSSSEKSELCWDLKAAGNTWLAPLGIVLNW